LISTFPITRSYCFSLLKKLLPVKMVVSDRSGPLSFKRANDNLLVSPDCHAVDMLYPPGNVNAEEFDLSLNDVEFAETSKLPRSEELRDIPAVS
jgi:hypothetical protein